eukprot:CAMPEP_0194251302 /NCGR_PEP_ID=MMETSP0158-20130606/25133_1 /TAXON_ID=33649 /ORGANISM="Thalassionema nitzschioides, Strain L26-B" /LENGTH=484 /DNA_ID=CAMNT_0038988405 /DNA_START=14 /DNA_END=1464 /DNA_ORIENTATION=-
MTSIPYDPSLILGNIVDMQRLAMLEVQKQITNPVEVAREKLNNLKRQLYKLNILYNQLVTMVDAVQLVKFSAQQVITKKAVSKAAVDYVKKFMKAQDQLLKLSEKDSKGTISSQVESPLNFALYEPKAHPISFDSIKFDCVFLQNTSNDEKSSSFADSVSAFIHGSIEEKGTGNKELSRSAHEAISQQTQRHKLEGSIIIVAHCTHKNALMIDPFIMDPVKALNAWNSLNPSDILVSTPYQMWSAATEEVTGKQSTLNILSGCTLASSFVGFVHILKEDFKDSTQTGSSVAKSVKVSVQAEMEKSAMGGEFGPSSSFSKATQNLLSTSNLSSHASLMCRGIIPSLKINAIKTSMQAMKPDVHDTMESLEVMKEDNGDPSDKTEESLANRQKRMSQFLNFTTSHIQSSTSALEKIETENRVIDIDSMIFAFSDFIDKASKGEGGVPIQFYLKQIRKNDIAKEYIKKFYANGPNGLFSDQKGKLGV